MWDHAERVMATVLGEIEAKSHNQRIKTAINPGEGAFYGPTLGREIVDAVQNYGRLSTSIQEQLCRAILHMTHLQALLEESRAENQYQLASLIVAAVRTDALADRIRPTLECRG